MITRRMVLVLATAAPALAAAAVVVRGGGGDTHPLKAMLTTGWNAAFGPIPVIGQLSTSPGD